MHDEARIDGATWEAMIAAAAETVSDHESDLNALDSTVGDGDHGTNFAAALAKAVAGADGTIEPTPAAVLDAVGSVIGEEMGGAAGVVFGAFFRGAARGAGADTGTDAARYATLLRSGLEQVQKWGKAEPGEKTVVDALAAAVAAADDAVSGRQPLASTVRSAADAALQGAERTAAMEARKGRARFLGERSVGFQDAGATSIALVLTAWADVVATAELDT